ncbi:MAG: hypothetical protein LLG97_12670 [Deltaproteobacteria bacterium]|nr:hypothetical protein [Deltaproteobacteria bacterium]
MFPNNPETWIFISVSCLIGFLIGQWLKSRRKKDKTADDYIEGLRRHALAETRLQAQKAKKPGKKKTKPSGGA